MTNEQPPTVASLLPPKVRQWVYALLASANGGYVVAEAAYDVPVPVLVAVGCVNAAGFAFATSKVR